MKLSFDIRTGKLLTSSVIGYETERYPACEGVKNTVHFSLGVKQIEMISLTERDSPRVKIDAAEFIVEVTTNE